MFYHFLCLFVVTCGPWLWIVQPKMKGRGSGYSSFNNSTGRLYIVLEDLWESYREWSAYGVEVPVSRKGEEDVKIYYAPYLSAIQLYAERYFVSLHFGSPMLIISHYFFFFVIGFASHQTVLSVLSKLIFSDFLLLLCSIFWLWSWNSLCFRIDFILFFLSDVTKCWEPKIHAWRMEFCHFLWCMSYWQE